MAGSAYGCRASTRPACRCSRAARPTVALAASASRTISCRNRNVPPSVASNCWAAAGAASASRSTAGRPSNAASSSMSSSGPMTAAARSMAPAGPSSSQRADTDSTSDMGSSARAACWASSVRNSGWPLDRSYSSSTRDGPTSSAAAARSSRPRWTDAVPGRAGPSPERIAATTTAGMPARCAKLSQLARARPARWASSITTTTSEPRRARRTSTLTSAAYSTAGPSMLSARIGSEGRGSPGPRKPGEAGGSRAMPSREVRVSASRPSRSAAASGPSRRSSADSADSRASSGMA